MVYSPYQFDNMGMGLIKLGLVGAAGYAIARKVQNKHDSSRTPSEKDNRPSYRDTASGYMHQGYCNGQCGRTCNGQQTHGLHDCTCNGQCGGQCVTQRRTAGSRGSNDYVTGGAAEGYYGAGGLGQREMLPSYSASAPVMKTGDVKA